MGHSKNKSAVKSSTEAQKPPHEPRDLPNEDFEAFLLRTNAQLDQAALRRGTHNAALHIFDSEAMYEEFFQLKKSLIRCYGTRTS